MSTRVEARAAKYEEALNESLFLVRRQWRKTVGQSDAMI